MFRQHLVFCLLALSVVSYTQQNPRIKKKDFFHSEINFKQAWRAVKEGNKNYVQGLGTYNIALEKYWMAMDYNDANAALNYKLGVCYLFTGKNKEKALQHIKKAYEINPYVASDINYLLGRAYHLNLDFENAIKEYNNYLSSLTDVQMRRLKIDISKLITECKYGQELVQQPKRIILQNLGSGINSTYDDYNPIIAPDNATMFYTSRRPNTTKGRRCPIDNKYYEDVYVSVHASEEWREGSNVNVGRKINTKHNNAAVGLSHNGHRLYVYHGNKRGGDILVSKMKNGKWRKPKKMPGKFRTKARETTMFMSADNNTFLFVSNKKKNSVGGKDIFICTKDRKGRWLAPRNIGSVINSPYDEEAPFLHPSGDTLYFSSQGFNSMGGFDVFKSIKDIDGKWGDPINLGYPINSPEDDIFYKLTDNPRMAYISTVRDEGLGGKDIYKIIYLGAEKEFLFTNEDDTLAWFKKPIPDLFYRKPVKLEIDTSFFLIGKVTDASSSNPVIAKLQLIDKEQSQVIGVTISEESGEYKIKLPRNCKKNYGVEINAAGYMFFVDTVNLKQEQFRNDIAIRNFQLDKVEVGAKMILKNIYFDTGKATLKPESFTELNRVVQFLKDNPSLKIEVSGHTDNVGTMALNKKLSKERAKSVVEYLIGNGIDKGKLHYEGYGYDQPIAPNTTEEGRSMNRRVEFKIISTK